MLRLRRAPLLRGPFAPSTAHPALEERVWTALAGVLSRGWLATATVRHGARAARLRAWWPPRMIAGLEEGGEHRGRGAWRAEDAPEAVVALVAWLAEGRAPKPPRE